MNLNKYRGDSKRARKELANGTRSYFYYSGEQSYGPITPAITYKIDLRVSPNRTVSGEISRDRYPAHEIWIYPGSGSPQESMVASPEKRTLCSICFQPYLHISSESSGVATIIHSYNFKWIALFSALALNGCTLADSRRSVAFVVPAGYVGWIRVKYNISSAPPLPSAKGKYIARIPANGLLKTSIIEEEGWGADTFYYVDKKGKATSLPCDPTNSNSLVWAPAGRTNETWMFIGTKQQWSDAQRLIGGATPGPLRLPITSQSEQKSHKPT